MKLLAIVGASGHGKVVADVAECCGWDVSFYDDDPTIGKNLGKWPVNGTFGDLLEKPGHYNGVIVGIGNNSIRLEKSKNLLAHLFPLVNIVHPASMVSKYARLESGSVVMPGAVINTDAHLGLACIVNSAATVDHDCTIADGVHISPGANLGGGVDVGECSWVGIGASVRHQIRIGSYVMIAAGAAVVKDVDDKVVVAGVPATPLR